MCVGDGSLEKSSQIAARDENRKLVLLVAIKTIPRPTEKDLMASTGIAQRSIYSVMKSLSNVGVVIERVNGRRHGYYKIVDEGPYNLEKVQVVLEKNYFDALRQIENCADRKAKETPFSVECGVILRA